MKTKFKNIEIIDHYNQSANQFQTSLINAKFSQFQKIDQILSTLNLKAQLAINENLQISLNVGTTNEQFDYEFNVVGDYNNFIDQTNWLNQKFWTNLKAIKPIYIEYGIDHIYIEYDIDHNSYLIGSLLSWKFVKPWQDYSWTDLATISNILDSFSNYFICVSDGDWYEENWQYEIWFQFIKTKLNLNPIIDQDFYNEINFDKVIIDQNGNFNLQGTLYWYNTEHQSIHDPTAFNIMISAKEFANLLLTLKDDSALRYYLEQIDWSQIEQFHFPDGIQTTNSILLDRIEAINDLYQPICKALQLNQNAIELYQWENQTSLIDRSCFSINGYEQWNDLLSAKKSDRTKLKQTLKIVKTANKQSKQDVYFNFHLYDKNFNINCEWNNDQTIGRLKWEIDQPIETITPTQWQKQLQIIFQAIDLWKTIKNDQNYCKQIEKVTNSKNLWQFINFKNNQFWVEFSQYADVKIDHPLLWTNLLDQFGLNDYALQLQNLESQLLKIKVTTQEQNQVIFNKF